MEEISNKVRPIIGGALITKAGGRVNAKKGGGECEKVGMWQGNDYGTFQKKKMRRKEIKKMETLVDEKERGGKRQRLGQVSAEGLQGGRCGGGGSNVQKKGWPKSGVGSKKLMMK